MEEISKQSYEQFIKNNLSKTNIKAIINLLIYLIPSILIFLILQFADVSLLPFIGSPIKIFNNLIYPSSVTTNWAVQPVPLWWLPQMIFIIFLITLPIAPIMMNDKIKNESTSEAYFFSVSYILSSYVVYFGWFIFLLAQILFFSSITDTTGSFFAFCLPFSLKSFFILLLAYSFRGNLLRQGKIFTDLRMKYNELKKM